MNDEFSRRTFAFAIRTVKLCEALEEGSGAGCSLGRALLRSGTAIGLNVEEALASRNPANVMAKYGIARKEARETHYWLRLLAEADQISPQRLIPITSECSRLIDALAAIIQQVQEEQR